TTTRKGSQQSLVGTRSMVTARRALTWSPEIGGSFLGSSLSCSGPAPRTIGRNLPRRTRSTGSATPAGTPDANRAFARRRGSLRGAPERVLRLKQYADPSHFRRQPRGGLAQRGGRRGLRLHRRLVRRPHSPVLLP